MGADTGHLSSVPCLDFEVWNPFSHFFYQRYAIKIYFTLRLELPRIEIKSDCSAIRCTCVYHLRKNGYGSVLGRFWYRLYSVSTKHDGRSHICRFPIIIFLKVPIFHKVSIPLVAKTKRIGLKLFCTYFIFIFVGTGFKPGFNPSVFVPYF